MSPHWPPRLRPATVASIAALLALSVYLAFPLLRCIDSCFIDYFDVHDPQTAHLEMPDTRLNAWILAWVHHGMLASPASLFDTNAFHPAKNTLAGSEHMLGVALQVLPLRLFPGGAVMLHQAAVILSFLLLSLTTFALVRWMTGSDAAALLAGAAAPFMPWRFSELGHLQLLSVQWLPLVWLLAARLLTERRTRRDAVWLAVVLGIQMLCSFYLAYLTLFSTGLIAAVILVACRPPRRAITQLVGAVAVPSAVVALTGIPYVARFSAYRFTEASATEFLASPGAILTVLAPPLSLRSDLAGLAPVTYHIPLAVLLCALLAFGWWAAPMAEGGDRARRIRAVSLGLAVAAAGALVLMLGRKIQLGDTEIRLPGHWLAKFVPGFSQMRAEFRWGIVLGVAFPVLAGAGIAWGEARLGRIANVSARTWAKATAGLAAAGLFALNIQWFQLPARSAWDDAEDVLHAHRALATLAPGPVVEIPWRIHPINTATNGSRYMLASSLHWNPLLNGYTAYVPDTYHFLQRIAQSLPDPRAIEYLRRLTGLRWIVLHPDRLGRQQRQLWSLAEQSGDLRVAVARPDFRIYDVAPEATNASWQAALLAEEPSKTTMTGLPRSPVELPARQGSLRVQVLDAMRYEHGSGMPYFAKVWLTNPSDETWPGLDIQTEGLVELRYRFFDDRGAIVREDTAPLDVDLPPHRTSAAQALIRPPAVAGRFRVRFDIVQRLGGELRDLGFPAAQSEVEVSERPLLSKPRGLRESSVDADD